MEKLIISLNSAENFDHFTINYFDFPYSQICLSTNFIKKSGFSSILAKNWNFHQIHQKILTILKKKNMHFHRKIEIFEKIGFLLGSNIRFSRLFIEKLKISLNSSENFEHFKKKNKVPDLCKMPLIRPRKMLNFRKNNFQTPFQWPPLRPIQKRIFYLNEIADLPIQ